MGCKVVMLKRADKALGALSKQMQKRTAHALRELTHYPEPRAGVEKLHKPLVGYRRRVGMYRMHLDIEKGVIFVRDIERRDKAYKKR